MLITAAFALLGIALVLQLVVARRTRGFWSVLALLVCAAILFAIHARVADRRVKNLDARIDAQCDALASDLETDLREYRMLSATGVSLLQDRYRANAFARGQLAKLCVPPTLSWSWWDCFPGVLTDDTLVRIGPAAEAIRSRQLCDTRSSVPLEVRCRELAQSLRASALTYRTATAENSGWSSIAPQVQASYRSNVSTNRELLRECVTEAKDLADCVPDDLNSHTLGRIERAATAIEARGPQCDTRDPSRGSTR